VSAPPFNNVHVRRAIAWAINRQEIIEHVWKGVYAVAKGPLSPATWAYDKNYAGMTYDPNKAKTELAQASGSGNISFTMLLTGNNPTLLQAAQFIQSELQAVGITLNIKQEVFATLVQDWQTFNYQAVFVGWTGSLDPDGTLYAMFTTKGGFNYTKDSVPQVDALLEQARTTADQAQRISLYQEAERLIVDDAARIFIWHAVSIRATSSKVKNYALLPSRVLDFTSVSLSS
jgi:peptide/nickel transport system substrate-binding protein